MEVWRRSGEELLRELAGVEARMRRDYAASLELIGELDSRGIVAEVGYPSLGVLLRDVLRIGTREASRRLDQARVVTARPVVSGGSVPAALPLAGAAARDGVLGGDYLAVLTAALGELPAHVSDEDREFAERTMVDAARELDAGRLARVGHRVREWLHDDGTSPDRRELAQPVNELHLTTRVDGRTAFRGELDRESSALLLTTLSSLARPRPSAATGPDPRTPAERQGDALAEIVRLAADTGTLPTEAGEKPHLLVTVPLAALRTDGDAGAVLAGVGRIDAAAARLLACDAKVIPVVLGSRSEPLDLGRASYTVSTALRRALIVRDRGCAFPGCDRPYHWCHSHHVRHWADGGTTELDNLVLLCGQHHRLVHRSEWECTVQRGRPEFRPPGFVDPCRNPRHNLLRTA